MASEDPCHHGHLETPPIIALKRAACYSCWEVPDTLQLSRCDACKSVSYCSKACQTTDWKHHKEICKALQDVHTGKQEVYKSPAGRTWKDYKKERRNEVGSVLVIRPGSQAVDRLFRLEPYCCHCYRDEFQLAKGMELSVCPDCRLTSFCPDCPQTHPSQTHSPQSHPPQIHPSSECTVLQNIVYDQRVIRDLRRQHGKSTIPPGLTLHPPKQYVPLSSVKDWYDYYTKLVGYSQFKSEIDRDIKIVSEKPDDVTRLFVGYLRLSTIISTYPLTLLAALEATIPDISSRNSIKIDIIGASGQELWLVAQLEELLHRLPSLKALHIAHIGLNKSLPDESTPKRIKTCPECTKMGKSIESSAWRGKYHRYARTHQTPVLAAAFHSGFVVADPKDWYPTIKYIANASHPTVFTSFSELEVKLEMKAWAKLGARLVKEPEINPWRSICPTLSCWAGVKPNDVFYRNGLWYVVGGKANGDS